VAGVPGQVELAVSHRFGHEASHRGDALFQDRSLVEAPPGSPQSGVQFVPDLPAPGRSIIRPEADLTTGIASRCPSGTPEMRCYTRPRSTTGGSAMLSPTHIVLLLLLILLALVVFGPKRLPELGSSVGKAIQEFRKASASTMDEVRSVTNSVSSTPTTSEPKTPDAEPAATAAPVTGTKPTD
jgi:sec-independent protein translocase protein TatA